MTKYKIIISQTNKPAPNLVKSTKTRDKPTEIKAT